MGQPQQRVGQLPVNLQAAFRDLFIKHAVEASQTISGAKSLKSAVGRPTSRKAREVGHPQFVSLPTIPAREVYRRTCGPRARVPHVSGFRNVGVGAGTTRGGLTLPRSDPLFPVPGFAAGVSDRHNLDVRPASPGKSEGRETSAARTCGYGKDRLPSGEELAQSRQAHDQILRRT